MAPILFRCDASLSIGSGHVKRRPEQKLILLRLLR